MSDITDETAKFLLNFGKWFKNSLILVLILSIGGASVRYIPVEEAYIAFLIFVRVSSLALVSFQIIMVVQLYLAKKSFEAKTYQQVLFFT